MARIPSPLEKVEDPLFDEKELRVYIKRDDLIHPEIMGNKWRKLKYNLKFVKENDLKGIVTFGGAFSNHIAATAAGCAEQGIPCIGFIRGDELNEASNDTLAFAHDKGMELRFIPRSAYKSFTQSPELLKVDFADHLILPEGGTNQLAIAGCAEIIDEISLDFDYIVTSVGTGGTMAGLISGLKGKGKVLGVWALKGEGLLFHFQKLLSDYDVGFPNYELIEGWHWGGYGKVSDDLVHFINETKSKINVLFDPIYTAKMYFAVRTLIETDYFDRGSTIVLVHTGGLQGINGINRGRTKKILV
ncbi:MAG: 1-aminocyclopropane-1-carboxylate deaminase [Marinoscillum sp.]|jgi:1-aminocyclopropane-1-carboxylate deaminase